MLFGFRECEDSDMLLNLTLSAAVVNKIQYFKGKMLKGAGAR